MKIALTSTLLLAFLVVKVFVCEQKMNWNCKNKGEKYIFKLLICKENLKGNHMGKVFLQYIWVGFEYVRAG